MRTKGSGQRDHKFRFSSSVNPTHSPEQSGAGLSAGAHADLLKLPAVRHRGDHLGQFLLLTLQHSVDVLRRHLLEGGGDREEGAVLMAQYSSPGKWSSISSLLRLPSEGK